MITQERAKEILTRYGIKTREELQRELRENPINIGIFTQPLHSKETNTQN